MSKWCMTCAVLAAVAGGLANADEVIVGVNERKSVSVAADETTVQSDAVWVAEGGTLDKVGKGDWTLPMSTLEQPGDVTIVVRDGSVTVPASGSAPTCAVPTETMNKAAFWVDAAVNVDQEGGNVSSWRDVRETKTAAPFDYPRAVTVENAPTVVDYPNSQTLKRIFFGGARTSKQWLRFVAPQNSGTGVGFSIGGIRHLFAVTGVFNLNAYFVGVENGGGDTTPLAFHPLNSTCPKNNSICTPSGVNLPAVMNARFWLNGKSADPTETKPKQDAHQLYEFKYCGPGTSRLGTAGDFYNDRGYDDRKGGDYLCEVLIFTNELAEAERIAVERYLIDRWALADGKGARSFAVAKGAQVNLTGDLDAYSFSGEGSIRVSGENSNLAFSPAFNGDMKLDPGVNARVTDDTYVFTVAAGDRLSVVDDAGGQSVSVATDVATDALVKEGSGSVSIEALPESVNRLVVSGGTLSLASRTVCSSVVSGSSVTGLIENASFEDLVVKEPLTSCDLYSSSSQTKTLYGWTGQFIAFPGSLVEPGANNDTYGKFIDRARDTTYTWLPDCPAPDGNWAFGMRGTGRIETTAQIPCDGVYELSFCLCGPTGVYRESQQWGGSPVDVYVGPDTDHLVHLGRSLKDGLYGYRKLIYRTPFLEKGPCVIRFSVDEAGTHRSPRLLDDVRLMLVSVANDEMPIPGGDFEDYSTENWFFDKTLCNDQPKGWTIHPPTGGDTLSQALIAREELTTGSSVMAAPADWRYGDTELLLVSDGASVSTTFTPMKTGRYRLRGRLGKWWRKIGTTELTADPIVTATLAVGEGDAVTLGTATTGRQRLTEITWPGVIVISDTTTSLTLSLRNTVGASAARVDDLTLVPIEAATADSDSFVENGSFESNANGWTCVNNGSASSDWAHQRSSCARRATINDANYGMNACPGYGDYGLSIIDYAAAYQTVSLPDAGRYRLRYHTRCRVSASFPSSLPYGSNSSVRAVLVVGSQTNELCNVRTATTNFVAHTAYFTVPAKGDYVIGFEGTNHPEVEGRDARDQMTFVDGISVVAVSDAEPVRKKLTLPETFELEIAKGAKLDADFNGRQKVTSVRLGGRRRSGVISAATDPEYISGDGELFVEPNGLMLIVR